MHVQQKPVNAEPVNHRYPTRHSLRQQANRGHSQTDTVARAVQLPPIDTSVPKGSFDTIGSDTELSTSSEGSPESSPVPSEDAPRPAPMERQTSGHVSKLLTEANLKTPKGPLFQMGLFRVGPQVHDLFEVFSEECVRSKQPFHQALADEKLTPSEWAQFLTNASSIYHAAEENALREDTNVSHSYGRLNQHPHAARSLQCLKSAGISTPSAPTKSVAALIDHMNSDPKCGDADAFLFNGMGLVFGQTIARQVKDLNESSWNLKDYRPMIFEYGTTEASISIGNSYFADLEKSLEGATPETMAKYKEHLKTTFALYTQALNEIQLSSTEETKDAEVPKASGGITSLPGRTAAYLGSWIPDRVAFWRPSTS